MRALILSDIHSNLEALQSVIKAAETDGGFDQLWLLGDLIGYGPDPVACIDLTREYDTVSVAGNHDLAAIGEFSAEAFNVYALAAVQWTSAQLSEEHRTYIGEMPLKQEMHDFTAVHGSPRDPIWEYLVSPASATVNFEHFDTTRCLVGHSHIPFICRPKDDSAVFLEFVLDAPLYLGQQRMIINPGGVGQPRDGDPRANYAVYDSEKDFVSHHRVEYDIPKTQDKMAERGLPKYLIDRLPQGR